MLVLSGPTGGTEHDGGGHPERPARIDAVMAGLQDLALGTELFTVPAQPASLAALLRVHEAEYLDELAAFCHRGGGNLDPDTYAREDSWAAALNAAGAGLAAIDALRARAEGVGFVVARPPGHHAVRDRAMGFCLLNNVAVAAAELAAAGERVLVLDWDVHHGNGTQDIFWDDSRVLYVSTHQSPLYPGTGRAQEIGGPHAAGLTVNIPLPPGATGDVVRRALEVVARPVIERFRPTWVLISAGFDAHRDDPMANLSLSSGDFAELARLVAQFAPRPGRVVAFLEGGYDLTALRYSVADTIGALLGGSDRREETTTGGRGADAVERAEQDRTVALARVVSAPPGGRQ
jgi:acetoin utilization deacetylase AcuC-like enzyme